MAWRMEATGDRRQASDATEGVLLFILMVIYLRAEGTCLPHTDSAQVTGYLMDRLFLVCGLRSVNSKSTYL